MKKNFLLLAVCSAIFCLAPVNNAQADLVVVANAAGDYVDAVAPPAGWEYLGANSLADAFGTGAFALTANTAVGNAGNLGFEGTVANNLAAVLGSATGANEFEVFTNGFENHGAVAGEELILHPGDGQFAVVRYTISADDLIGATADAGDDQIDFSFIDAVTGGGGANGSVASYVYLNDTQLFENVPAVNADNRVSNVSDALTVDLAVGDTISFIVGDNGGIGSDETTFQGLISVNTAAAVPEPSSLAILAIGAIGIAGRRRRKN